MTHDLIGNERTEEGAGSPALAKWSLTSGEMRSVVSRP